ncbi:hypothetical protein H1R20_g9789, partial [Candolleomyces eurysporus]
MVIATSVSLHRLKIRKVTAGVKRSILNPRRITRKLTTAEKATLANIRAQKRAKYDKALEEAQDALREVALVMQAKVPGHQLDYYLRVITQAITRSNIKTRKTVSGWNAFLSKETRKRNAEREPGTAPIKTSDISKELSVQWHAMSPEEQHEQTHEMVESLQVAREVKKTGQHNTNITAFHDARATVAHIQTEVSAITVVMGPTDAGGIDGLSRNYIERLVQLKGLTAAIIKEKLVNAAGHPISRMMYTNFDEAITLKHGVILKGWPLPKFCCPSHLTACSDLEILYNAWKSGVAHFVKLDDNEYDKWHTEYLQRRAAGMVDQPINPVSNGESINTTVPPVDDPSAHTNDLPVNVNVQHAIEGPPVPPVLAPATTFMNFAPDGSVVAPKARKTRKDKGVPRGSRKGKVPVYLAQINVSWSNPPPYAQLVSWGFDEDQTTERFKPRSFEDDFEEEELRAELAARTTRGLIDQPIPTERNEQGWKILPKRWVARIFHHSNEWSFDPWREWVSVQDSLTEFRKSPHHKGNALRIFPSGTIDVVPRQDFAPKDDVIIPKEYCWVEGQYGFEIHYGDKPRYDCRKGYHWLFLAKYNKWVESWDTWNTKMTAKEAFIHRENCSECLDGEGCRQR